MPVIHDFKGLLPSRGLKETPKRLLLLKLLALERAPMTITALSKKARGVDTVTIYRALEAFVTVGIVERVDFHKPEARYELAVGRHHHHHLVCSGCGIVEDIEDCHPKGLEQSVLKSSSRFALISGHSLEFFGTCTKCITK